MAKKNDPREARFDYNREVRLLRQQGPERLYLLWGPEDYLRECYLRELKKSCLPEGEESFSYRRLNGPELDALTLREAVDAAPFLTERSLVEIREPDLNKQKEPETLLKLLTDLPDYCTVVLVLGSGYEPDGRLKLVKGLRAAAKDLKFTSQSQGDLTNWIARRFAAAGKSIDPEAAQHLIFISGDLMNRLIPEIEKIAAYAKGESVTVADVDAVASRIPEAVIFEMTDAIAQKQYNSALEILSELLSDRNNEPIPMLAMLGMQMRRLYAARLALEGGLGQGYLMETCELRYDSLARKLLQSARGFTLEQLRCAVELCAEADYRMKSSMEDDAEILKETVLRIAAGESHAA